MSDPLLEALEKHQARVEHANRTLESGLFGPPTDQTPKVPYTDRESRNRYLLVQMLRERDGPNCYLCQTPLTADQSHVEHIIPTSLGGDNEPYNVAISCHSCNSIKAMRYVSLDVTSGAPVYHQNRSTGGW